MDTSPKSQVDVNEGGAERGTRRMRSLEEKLAILREAAEPGASIAAVARKHGMNANLLFGWRRMRRQGLLETQRHAKAVPLLPVKITTPTLTPSDPSSAQVVSRRRRTVLDAAAADSCVELVLPDGIRVRLFGQAQRAVLDRVLARLGSR